MTETGFRRIALGMKGVVEKSHMDHPAEQATPRRRPGARPRR